MQAVGDVRTRYLLLADEEESEVDEDADVEGEDDAWAFVKIEDVAILVVLAHEIEIVE